MATFPSEVSAATGSARDLLAAWRSQSRVDIVQESSSRVAYRGTWKKTSYTGYLGGSARWTKTAGASAGLTFTGSGVAWVGPVGPTRGKAKVYVDGAYVTTVNTRADSFSPARVLFRKSWASVGTHRIKIVALGTPGHPTVALDALLVRLDAVPAQTGSGSSVRVSSIPALLTALNDNSVTDIVVANGRYRVSPAPEKTSTSLWIGARFADRTRAVTVRAETRGGVTFDGGGGLFGGITFAEGAHDQVWDGFRFTNGMPQESGVIVFGGYANLAPPHHITLRNITVDGLIAGSTPPDGYPIYFSMAAYPGPHDLLIENFKSTVTGNVSGAHLHFYHDTASGDPAGNYNARNVTIRNATLSGSVQSVMFWAKSISNVVIEDTTITGALDYAVRYELGGTVTLRRVTSTNSGDGGFYSSLGADPAGITFIDTSLH